MKILLIHNQYKQAGGEDVAFELEADLLRQKGNDVETLIFSNEQISSFHTKIQFGIQSFYNVVSKKKLIDKINQFEPAVIHIHNLFFTASPSILFAASRNKIPVFITLHNYRLVCSNALLMRDNKVCELCLAKKFPIYGIKYKCYRNSALESALVTGVTGMHKLIRTWNKYVTQYISLTEFSKQKFLSSSLNLGVNQITTLPNYVPDPKIFSQRRMNYFLYVGRLSAEKGINILLHAFSSIHSSQLIIVGDGPEKEAVERHSAVYPNIVFIGKKSREDVLELMSNSNALIFPSVCYEGLPFTILEAFSVGTPVIASNLGAMSTIIEDEVNGLFFRANDAEDLATCLQKFSQLDDNQKYNLQIQARATYENKYNPEAHYEKLMMLYKKALKSKNEA